MNTWTNRGGKGVKTMNITNKTGELIAIKEVKDGDDLMIINRSGLIIRLSVEDLRVMGRATQGVRLINLKDDDSIASVAKVDASVVAETAEVEENGEEDAEGNSTEPAGEEDVNKS